MALGASEREGQGKCTLCSGESENPGERGAGEGTGVLIEKECAGGFVFHPDGFSLEDSGEDLNAAAPEVSHGIALPGFSAFLGLKLKHR